MSDSSGGGVSVAVIAGAGIGGCAIVVGVIALAIYCYMKARREKSKPSMTKSSDIFTTDASRQSSDYPRRSRVNQFPDPEAARKARREERDRDRERDVGHVNPAYARNSSDSSSISSDIEGGRDVSPARVRTRGGERNMAFSSESSMDDSSSIDDVDVVPGYSMERELNNRQRMSYKMARQKGDLLDNGTGYNDTKFSREGEGRRSRRDEFQRRNPRSDSPLTVAQVSKHDEITRRETEQKDSRSVKSRRRDTSPSSRTYESSVDTGTTLGTDFTATTKSSGHFQKNPSLRRNSPSRSSSHRRYKRDKDETDSKGRRRPRRTRSSDRQHRSHSDRSRSPASSQRSHSSSGSRRSHGSSQREAKKMNKEQAILPIFADPKSKKKTSAV